MVGAWVGESGEERKKKKERGEGETEEREPTGRTRKLEEAIKYNIWFRSGATVHSYG